MNNIDLRTSQSLSISNISEWFKDLDWVGIGIGAFGVMVIVYYLTKKEKK